MNSSLDVPSNGSQALQVELSLAHAKALALMLARMNFDHYLNLTDGDEEQAYFFQRAASSLRKAIND